MISFLGLLTMQVGVLVLSTSFIVSMLMYNNNVQIAIIQNKIKIFIIRQIHTLYHNEIL